MAKVKLNYISKPATITITETRAPYEFTYNDDYDYLQSIFEDSLHYVLQGRCDPKWFIDNLKRVKDRTYSPKIKGLVDAYLAKMMEIEENAKREK